MRAFVLGFWVFLHITCASTPSDPSSRFSQRIGPQAPPPDKAEQLLSRPGWQRSARNPVVFPKLFAQQLAVLSPSVLFNKKKQRYSMWYAAISRTSVVDQKKSRTPILFSKPVLTPFGSRFIYRQDSDDGESWTNLRLALPLPEWGTPTGQLWESGVFAPTVLHDSDGQYHMWFIGLSFFGKSSAKESSTCILPQHTTDYQKMTEAWDASCVIYGRFSLLHTKSSDAEHWRSPVPVMGFYDENFSLASSLPQPFAPSVFYDPRSRNLHDMDASDLDNGKGLWFMVTTIFHAPLRAVSLNKDGVSVPHNSPEVDHFVFPVFPVPDVQKLEQKQTSLHIAQSRDGQTWQSIGQIFPGTEQEDAWDRYGYNSTQLMDGYEHLIAVREASLLQIYSGISSKYLLFYDGTRQKGSKSAIGVIHGEEKDGNLVWDYRYGAPFLWQREEIFSSSPRMTTWDNHGTSAPSLIWDGLKLKMWYRGFSMEQDAPTSLQKLYHDNIRTSRIGFSVISRESIPPTIIPDDPRPES